MPVSITYPLTKSLAPNIDALANLIDLQREACAFFAVGVVGLIAEYAQHANGGDYLAKARPIAITEFGETELDGTISIRPTIDHATTERIRVSFPTMAYGYDPSITVVAMAEWFGCSTEDVLVYAVIWIFEALSKVRNGGTLVFRCALNTEFMLYKSTQHEQIMGRVAAMQRGWEDKGGGVVVEGRWDVVSRG